MMYQLRWWRAAHRERIGLTLALPTTLLIQNSPDILDKGTALSVSPLVEVALFLALAATTVLVFTCLRTSWAQTTYALSIGRKPWSYCRPSPASRFLRTGERG